MRNCVTNMVIDWNFNAILDGFYAEFFSLCLLETCYVLIAQDCFKSIRNLITSIREDGPKEKHRSQTALKLMMQDISINQVKD